MLKTNYSGLIGVHNNHRLPIDREMMPSGYCLNIEQQLKLCASLLETDITKAIFSIPNAKSPRPDGFSSGFFKKSWEVMGPLVSNMVQGFFQMDRILNHCNATSLMLLPKVQNPNNSSEFRPICCCNVI